MLAQAAQMSIGLGTASQCGTLDARNCNSSGGIETRSPAHNRTVPVSSPGGPTVFAMNLGQFPSVSIRLRNIACDEGTENMSHPWTR